ncbi:unnamed protein product [Caenorhabditis angaria]|uniref:T20D4.11-like domain-containing protein n=1 Tax=Caenorhabditis angaria TaxID=860376 RepID=A0A9P1J0E9_9PELO|nr:unnamed protein product [Caenorhabditis angaria]
MVTTVLILVLISLSQIDSAPKCTSSEIRKAAETCIQKIGEVFLQLSEQSFNDSKSFEYVNDLCETSMDCFENLEDCADFEESFINNIEDMCAMSKFANGEVFFECGKIIDEHPGAKCVTEFLTYPANVNTTRGDKCDNLNERGRCAKEQVSALCSPEAVEELENHINEQTERYNC